MRFLKEYFIVISILIIVFLIENLTSKSLNNATSSLENGIQSVENKVLEAKKEEAKNEFKDLKKNWNDESEKLALFVEHNELEKISKDIVIVESNLENNDTNEILENIDELQFMLKHVNEKYKLTLKNVF